jgi:hypothetical protein
MAVVAILIGLAVTGCGVLSSCGVRLPGDDSGFSSGIGVDNRTVRTLHFRVFDRDRSYDLAPTALGRQTALVIGNSSHTSILEDGCTVGDLVAFDENENEVARHPPPLCIDDVWVIEPDAPAGAEPSPSN